MIQFGEHVCLHWVDTTSQCIYVYISIYIIYYIYYIYIYVNPFLYTQYFLGRSTSQEKLPNLKDVMSSCWWLVSQTIATYPPSLHDGYSRSWMAWMILASWRKRLNGHKFEPWMWQIICIFMTSCWPKSAQNQQDVSSLKSRCKIQLFFGGRWLHKFGDQSWGNT